MLLWFAKLYYSSILIIVYTEMQWLKALPYNVNKT